MKRAWLVGLIVSIGLAAQQPPKVMTKMVVQLDSPDAPAGSFAAKPKTMYRAGEAKREETRRMRPEKSMEMLKNGVKTPG